MYGLGCSVAPSVATIYVQIVPDVAKTAFARLLLARTVLVLGRIHGNVVLVILKRTAQRSHSLLHTGRAKKSSVYVWIYADFKNPTDTSSQQVAGRVSLAILPYSLITTHHDIMPPRHYTTTTLHHNDTIPPRHYDTTILCHCNMNLDLTGLA